MIKSLIFALLSTTVLGQYGQYGQGKDGQYGQAKDGQYTTTSHHHCDEKSAYVTPTAAAAVVGADSMSMSMTMQYTAVLQTIVPVTTPTMTGEWPNLASYTVTVGGANPPAYTPASMINIVDQETIVFLFYSKNHTVTQSSFDQPCQKMDGGFKSGFVPSDSQTIPYMVAQYSCPQQPCAPMWLYCGQADHCELGMRMSINAPPEKDQAWRSIDTSGAAGGSGGGYYSPSATAPAAPAAPPPPSSGSNNIVPGYGSMDSGSCECNCFCGVADFPPPNGGYGMQGGVWGSIPTTAAM